MYIVQLVIVTILQLVVRNVVVDAFVVHLRKWLKSGIRWDSV